MAVQWPMRFPRLITDRYTAKSNPKTHEWLESPKSSSSSSRDSSFLTTPQSSASSHSGHNAPQYDHARCLTYGPLHMECQERAVTSRDPESLGQPRRPTPFVKRQADEPPGGQVAAVHTSTKRTPTTTGSHVILIEEGKSLDEVRQRLASEGTRKDVPNSIPFPTAYRGNSTGTVSSRGSPLFFRGRSSTSRRSKIGPHHFLVSRQVGKGGFGSVYEGIEVQSGQVVAIKTVSRHGLPRHRVESVLKEQVISKKVSEDRNQPDASENGSEFVVKMVSSFLTPSHFVFVLEYHGAGDLRDVDFPLKTEDARFYIGEMALGLRYLHSKNIILRDLKPANALLGFDGHVRLADFGLATIVEPEKNKEKRDKEPPSPRRERNSSLLPFIARTRSGSLRTVTDALRLSNLGLGSGRKRSNTPENPFQLALEAKSTLDRSKSWFPGKGNECRRLQQTILCGTPGYISPEGYRGRHGPEGDIWALGITLYEFITGVNPFDTWGEPTKEIKTKVQQSEPFYPEGMPKETRSVLKKLLHKKWKKRATLDEMMAHPFFKVDDFSWERLQKKQIDPPPLPKGSWEALRGPGKTQSRSNNASPHPEMPLILYLEYESMNAPANGTFREELSMHEAQSFYMDGIDSRM